MLFRLSILAIEWLSACLGLDMRHGLKSTETPASRTLSHLLCPGILPSEH
ncbi:hypothetical protein SAMN04487958_101174 [Vreelandella subterranea]|uniref:Uncharacterized protein n=1 Tax=Vreelandella subterranea TaxID=416874 RepID=A0A1H9PCX5_9GAMM|nr:hypothetical protein SAMN04487958_101174 [Halomonas subterranea]